MLVKMFKILPNFNVSTLYYCVIWPGLNHTLSVAWDPCITPRRVELRKHSYLMLVGAYSYPFRNFECCIHKVLMLHPVLRLSPFLKNENIQTHRQVLVENVFSYFLSPEISV